MPATDLVVAVTGASGAGYGVRLVEVLLRAGRVVHLIVSPAGAEVVATELGRALALEEGKFDPAALLGPAAKGLDLSRLRYHHFRNFRAGVASGSFLTAGMAVCPCSMGTLSAVARGASENLIQRAADVHLKERRKLVLVPRETPLGLVQLRNMVAVAEAGAVVLPAMPGFYTQPQRVQDLVDFVVGRVCDQLGVEHRLFERWGGGSSGPA
jgi:4-hydroxy-3-polyprenylbenzoate decarboxylase